MTYQDGLEAQRVTVILCVTNMHNESLLEGQTERIFERGWLVGTLTSTATSSSTIARPPLVGTLLVDLTLMISEENSSGGQLVGRSACDDTPGATSS